MKKLPILSTLLLGTTLLACSHSKNENGAPSDQGTIAKSTHPIEKKIYHSGGVPTEFDLCPQSPFDTVTQITSLNPAPPAGTPEMTIEGVYEFIQENNITTIEALLDTFPDHYRTNFSLVEHTRAAGESNLEYPRIVLFGSDGRFMLNVGTKPDDPTYDKLDVAELHTDTGHWEFSVFDFTQDKPALVRNDESCNECHGTDNSRPVWGDFQQWTGVFGDSIVDGPRPEALDHTHAIKMNEIQQGKGGSARFDFLIWKPVLMHRGGFRDIAHHDFGPELLLSNIAMGSATSLGAYIRLTQKYPEKYKALRKELLLSYFKKRSDAIRYPIKINHSKETLAYTEEMNKKVGEELKGLDVKSTSLDEKLLSLGLDTSEAFSLATLHERETPQPNWNLAVSDNYDLLMLQILNELREDDAEINRILNETSLKFPIFNCVDTAKNMAELIDFKMLHLFHLAGEARYKVNWIYYPQDLDDIYDQVFLPISMELIDYLKDA